MEYTTGLEWAGSLLSIAGAHFNAGGAPVKAYLCWIPSSLLLILFALFTRHWGLCLMQVMFLYYNLSGHAFWRRSSIITACDPGSQKAVQTSEV